jgi:hypothetical protein
MLLLVLFCRHDNDVIGLQGRRCPADNGPRIYPDSTQAHSVSYAVWQSRIDLSYLLYLSMV